MITMLALLLGLIATGTAVFLALGVTATSLLFVEGHGLGGIAQILVDRLNSSTLTAIPFFVTAATFMQRGGMAAALVNAAEAWIGGFRGGVAIVAVAAAALFASVSGSSTATALALGTILLPALAQRGYPARFSAGLVGASATLGILLPPSLALIVFSLIAEVSVRKLFVAGLIPGLIQGALFIVWILFVTRRMQLIVPPKRMPLREKLRLTYEVIPAMLVPIVALGGIYSGIVTLSEASALAALVAIVICVLNGTCRGLRILAWVGDAVIAASAILILVGVAVLLGHWIVLSGVAERLVSWFQQSGVTPLQFLLAMNLVMFVLGMFLEIISTILITLPIVLPLLGPLGINPVHYAIVVIVNMELAALTPPVGLNLFVMKSVSQLPIATVMRGFIPFVTLLLILLALVTLFPPLSLWLPERLQ